MVWTGSSWHIVQAVGPFIGANLALAFDARTQQLVALVSGKGTWVLKGSAWVRATSSGPTGGQVVYDPASGKLLGFDVQTTKVWTWTGTGWASPKPGVELYTGTCGPAYDPSVGRLIGFGTLMGGLPYDQTFSWDGQRWDPLRTQGQPSQESYAAFAYDQAAREGVVFGGYNEINLNLATTWVLRVR
jgi:hypothetical protein